MIDGILAVHTLAHWLREIDLVLAGFVLGFALVAFFRYLAHFKDAVTQSERVLLRLSAGVAFVIGLAALHLATARSFAELEDLPLEWRDVSALIWLINATLVLSYALRNEKYWWRREKSKKDD